MNTVTTTIKVGTNPKALSVDASTNTIYVVNYADNTVSIVDRKANKIIVAIPVGLHPSAASVNPLPNIAYVANYDDRSVSVIDGKTNNLIPIR
jgi:YVTN family beta-propeller protein